MVNKIPLKIEGIDENFYSGFWSRFVANFLDGLIIIPYSLLLIYLNSFHLYAYFATLIPNILFIFWYNVYLPKRYGGTPGKLIIGLKIVKMDSSEIDWKEAFLRYSVNIVFVIINIAVMGMAILSADIFEYNTLTWLNKNIYLGTLANANIIQILSNIWIWSEIIVLLFNKRKRALHDFIAGTVVVKDLYLEKIRKKMKELNSADIQEKTNNENKEEGEGF